MRDCIPSLPFRQGVKKHLTDEEMAGGGEPGGYEQTSCGSSRCRSSSGTGGAHKKNDAHFWSPQWPCSETLQVHPKKRSRAQNPRTRPTQPERVHKEPQDTTQISPNRQQSRLTTTLKRRPTMCASHMHVCMCLYVHADVVCGVIAHNVLIQVHRHTHVHKCAQHMSVYVCVPRTCVFFVCVEFVCPRACA